MFRNRRIRASSFAALFCLYFVIGEHADHADFFDDCELRSGDESCSSNPTPNMQDSNILIQTGVHAGRVSIEKAEVRTTDAKQESKLSLTEVQIRSTEAQIRFVAEIAEMVRSNYFTASMVGLVMLCAVFAAWIYHGYLSTRQDVSTETPSTESLKTVLFLLHNVWPAIILTGFGIGMLMPIESYISLNFFAQGYTHLPPGDIHCETSPDLPYCKEAVNDNVKWTSIISFVSAVVHFSLASSMGVLSDTCGRKPVIVVSSILGLLPHLAQFLFVFCNVTLYLWYGLLIFAFLPVLGVWFALITDLIENPELRAITFGITLAVYEFSMLAGMVSGVFLSLRTAVAVGLLVHIANVIYRCVFLYETLPVEKRSPPKVQQMFPVTGLSILLRNENLRRLCIVFMMNEFCATGMDTIGVSYFQKYLDWDKNANTTNAILGSVSDLAWVGCFLNVIIACAGEVGLLFVGQAGGMIYCVGIYIVTSLTRNHRPIFMLHGTISGVMALTFPATAALKGSMVGGDEQGHIQGAVQGVKSVAGCLGPFVFGIIFNALDGATGFGSSGNLSRLMFLIAAVLYLCTLPVIASLPRDLMRQKCDAPEGS